MTHEKRRSSGVTPADAVSQKADFEEPRAESGPRDVQGPMERKMSTTPITKLPDGSAFFTATVMSREEAMALPLNERPLCYRLSSELYHAVFEAIGEASMCWNPRPSNEVFASEQAADVATRLCFKIAEEIEKFFKTHEQPLSSGVRIAAAATQTI